MPRKKTVVPDEQPVEALTAAETGGEESAGQLPESCPLPDAAPSEERESIPADGDAPSDGLPADPPAGEEPPGDMPSDGEAQPGDMPSDGEAQPGDMPPDGEAQPGDSASGEAPNADGPPSDGTQWGDMPPNFPAGEEDPFPDTGDAAGSQPPQEEPGPESDDPEYGALLQELGETGQGGADADEPLTLDPPPGEEPSGGPVPTAVPDGVEDGMSESALPRRPRGRSRHTESAAATTAAADSRRDRVLTIEARDEVQTAEEQEAIIWHEIQNAHWTRRILTGTLDGVERTESGLTVAVVNYKGFRVAIPVKEMMLFTGRVPSGAEFQELMSRMRGILTARLGSEIDFIVKGHENKSRSVVASRKDAMYRKRQTFYLDKDERGEPMIYEGRVVQARVVAVAEKVVRVEVFGVECAILARGLSRAWVGDAAEHYHVGDRILVRVQKITGTTVEDLSITADVRSTSASTAADDLKKCVRQGRYAGRVTDVRGGVLYVRLNNGVNAIAHSCYDRRTPGKGDDVSFAVTRLDEEQGVAVGSITRIIKQNL